MTESGSSIQAFMTCNKLYWFKYVRMLESRSYSSALGLGTFLHAEIERHNGGRVDAVEVELARYLAQKTQEYHNQIKLDRAAAERMFELWRGHWATNHPHANHNFEWLRAEQEWRFNVNELGDRHVGKGDGLVRHKPTNAIFYYELKTAADRDREGYVHKLEIDRQVSSNLLAPKREGIDVQGVLYDVVWKPGIRRLTGRKTKPDETQEEFMERMVSLMTLEPATYFERHIVYRSDRLLAEHEKDLELQFGAIAHAHEHGFPRNTGACDNFGLCPFFSACVEGREELLELYDRRDRKHPELSKEIQRADS